MVREIYLKQFDVKNKRLELLNCLAQEDVYSTDAK